MHGQRMKNKPLHNTVLQRKTGGGIPKGFATSPSTPVGPGVTSQPAKAKVPGHTFMPSSMVHKRVGPK